MSSKHKYENVMIRVKKQWEVRTGHHNHICGSGSHDSRPKRMRTREAIDKQWKQEYNV